MERNPALECFDVRSRSGNYRALLGLCGRDATPDAFLIAAAMMMDRRRPGLWRVLTGYESEWIPSADGCNPPAPMCQAVALALTPADADAAGLHLSIGPAPDDQSLTVP